MSRHTQKTMEKVTTIIRAHNNKAVFENSIVEMIDETEDGIIFNVLSEFPKNTIDQNY